MCYPALIPLAMAAAGAASNYAGQKQVVGAREDVARAEGERQDAYQARANDVIDQNLVKQAPAAQNAALAQTGEERLSALAPSEGASAGLPTSGSAPIEVKGEVARQMSDAIRKGRSRLGAQARLGALNQNQTENQRLIGRGMTDLGQIANFSQGSSGVLPYALQDAQNAGAGYRNAADLFNLASTATSLYQQTGGGATASRYPTIGAAGTNFSPVAPRGPVSLYQVPRRY